MADRVSLYMHSHTLYGAIRPFGVAVILSSYENNQPQLYTIEPSGVYYVCLTMIKFYEIKINEHEYFQLII